jgi:hypothetical protein
LVKLEELAAIGKKDLLFQSYPDQDNSGREI